MIGVEAPPLGQRRPQDAGVLVGQRHHRLPHDNAVAESFVPLLKRQRIRRRTCTSREEARQDVFDYIEMFYNPKRRHGNSDRLSPAEFERRCFSTPASL